MRIDDYVGIISRFESGKFASSEASLQYYATALARTNQAEQIVPKILQRLQRQPLATESEVLLNNIGQSVRRTNTVALSENAGVNGGAAMADAMASAGNKANPIYVVMDDTKSKREDARESKCRIFARLLYKPCYLLLNSCTGFNSVQGPYAMERIALARNNCDLRLLHPYVFVASF